MIQSLHITEQKDWSPEIMRFTLTYDGPLPPSGNKPKPQYAWMIRRAVHAQLEDLWQTSEVLKRLLGNTSIPRSGGFMWWDYHHSDPDDVKDPESDDGYINLCEPIEDHGHNVLPLVRESLATICGLKILMLRQEEPGSLFSQSGDIDNRMKTLLDGLRMPRHKEAWDGQNDIPDPLYCLLEDDKLITDYSLKTDRLLASNNMDPKDIRLVVEVTIRASIVKSYNLPLLGD